MPASPGTTCNCGRKSTKRVLKFRGSVTQTRSPIILRRNINLRRSFSVRCAGTSRSLDPIDDGRKGSLRWGQDLGRIDAAIGYRFTSHTQLKLQYSFQHETTGPHDDNHLLAAQFTVRF